MLNISEYMTNEKDQIIKNFKMEKQNFKYKSSHKIYRFRYKNNDYF